MAKEKSRNNAQTTDLFRERSRPQTGDGNTINPAVVKTVNILDISKAIVLSSGVPPKSKSAVAKSAATKAPAVKVMAVKEPIKTTSVQLLNLIRYHLVGDSGWKTVFGFRTDTSIQPIHIIKDSRIHSLVVSSPNEIIPKCVIKIHFTSNDETKTITISIKEEIKGSCVLTPRDSNQSIEWSEDYELIKGSLLSVRIEEENSLDLELYLQ